MRILITGARGQLGSEISEMIEERFSTLGKIDNVYSESKVLSTSKDSLDITSINNVREMLIGFRPNIVINAAAFTNVDKCETDLDLAFEVNVLGARNLAIVCKEIDSKLIHLSTDYVFNGNNDIPYKEYDSPNPINVYGDTKYLGEKYVQQFCDKYFILRTSWLFGKKGKNFVKTIIKIAAESDQIDVVADQVGNPTNSEDLSFHILKLALTDEYGIYHCSGNGSCSWFEFAKKIIEYKNMDCLINPIKTKELKQVAKRPSYSCLDNLMLRCTIGDKMRHWEDALKTFIKKSEL